MGNNVDPVKDEPIVMADECGDSMWDAVLKQDAKVCDMEAASKNSTSFPPDLNAT